MRLPAGRCCSGGGSQQRCPQRPHLVQRRAHLWAAGLQQCMLTLAAVQRCWAPSTGTAGASFVDLFNPSCFTALASILDWPFHIAVPDAPDGPGALSPRAGCLACTLWAQLTLGGLLPTVL